MFSFSSLRTTARLTLIRKKVPVALQLTSTASEDTSPARTNAGCSGSHQTLKPVFKSEITRKSPAFSHYGLCTLHSILCSSTAIGYLLHNQQQATRPCHRAKHNWPKPPAKQEQPVSQCGPTMSSAPQCGNTRDAIIRRRRRRRCLPAAAAAGPDGSAWVNRTTRDK